MNEKNLAVVWSNISQDLQNTKIGSWNHITISSTSFDVLTTKSCSFNGHSLRHRVVSSYTRQQKMRLHKQNFAELDRRDSNESVTLKLICILKCLCSRRLTFYFYNYLCDVTSIILIEIYAKSNSKDDYINIRNVLMFLSNYLAAEHVISLNPFSRFAWPQSVTLKNFSHLPFSDQCRSRMQLWTRQFLRLF